MHCSDTSMCMHARTRAHARTHARTHKAYLGNKETSLPLQSHLTEGIVTCHHGRVATCDLVTKVGTVHVELAVLAHSHRRLNEDGASGARVGTAASHRLQGAVEVVVLVDVDGNTTSTSATTVWQYQPTSVLIHLNCFI